MKTIRIIIAFALLALGVLATGCATASYEQKLAEFDNLGITEATITGKFSNTEYTRTENDGKITSTLDHSNAWVPKVHIKRVRPVADKN